ncbi:unnamed protein product [Owenia fusiformis]|nr:unnamed protein product [Owenia fusiformis]
MVPMMEYFDRNGGYDQITTWLGDALYQANFTLVDELCEVLGTMVEKVALAIDDCNNGELESWWSDQLDCDTNPGYTLYKRVCNGKVLSEMWEGLRGHNVYEAIPHNTTIRRLFDTNTYMVAFMQAVYSYNPALDTSGMSERELENRKIDKQYICSSYKSATTSIRRLFEKHADDFPVAPNNVAKNGYKCGMLFAIPYCVEDLCGITAETCLTAGERVEVTPEVKKSTCRRTVGMFGLSHIERQVPSESGDGTFTTKRVTASIMTSGVVDILKNDYMSLTATFEAIPGSAKQATKLRSVEFQLLDHSTGEVALQYTMDAANYKETFDNDVTQQGAAGEEIKISSTSKRRRITHGPTGSFVQLSRFVVSDSLTLYLLVSRLPCEVLEMSSGILAQGLTSDQLVELDPVSDSTTRRRRQTSSTLTEAQIEEACGSDATCRYDVSQTNELGAAVTVQEFDSQSNEIEAADDTFTNEDGGSGDGAGHILPSVLVFISLIITHFI